MTGIEQEASMKHLIVSAFAVVALIAAGPANAATVHHAKARHHVGVSPSHSWTPGFADPGWSGAYAGPRPPVHYNAAPSYDDPSKLGGGG
jgi:hypothetical protein